MKILVLGGAGFIGSHLVDKLLKLGHKVIVLDNFSTGKIENLSVGVPNLGIIEGSILNNSIEYLFKGIDIVFHLAALTRPLESFIDPIKYNQVNVEGTLRMLMLANKHNVKKFIFTSSSSGYGFQDSYPFTEEFQFKPASPYATTKQIGENYCKLFKNMGDMKINWVRPFNVYGKRQDPDSPYGAAVPKFIKTLRYEGKPFITGDGSQFRDFIFVEDLVDLFIKISESECNGESFNGGSGEKTSILELYEIISKLLDKSIEPEYRPSVNDPDTLADISKAKELLGWIPKHSLKEGLLKTI